MIKDYPHDYHYYDSMYSSTCIFLLPCLIKKQNAKVNIFIRALEQNFLKGIYNRLLPINFFL